MANRNKRDEDWARAKRLCRLNAETVRMAKALGLNPRKLPQQIPSKSQPWKAPVHVWIRDLYEKMQEKAAQRWTAKQALQAACPNDPGDPPPAEPCPTEPSPDDPARTVGRRDALDQAAAALFSNGCGEESPDEFDDFDEDYWRDDEPSESDIEQQNRAMLQRQKDLRTAAEFVAQELGRLPVVRRVVLIGSVASPLKKEVPRFREFRRARIAIWHECGDVDLAVWVSDPGSLRSLQKARSRALDDLLAQRSIGVAHHQVEVFLMEPGTDRYLGRLCCFGSCPRGKLDCQVPGCGEHKLLRQHTHFTFHTHALAPDRSVVLYEAQPDLGDESEEPIPF